MVGLIIATHGELGKAFKESVALLTGECKNVVTLALEKNDNSEEIRERRDKTSRSGRWSYIIYRCFGGNSIEYGNIIGKKKSTVLYDRSKFTNDH